jgi:hypothetical protein
VRCVMQCMFDGWGGDRFIWRVSASGKGECRGAAVFGEEGWR